MSRSARCLRAPGLLWQPPVDPFEQISQLRRRDRHRCAGENKAVRELGRAEAGGHAPQHDPQQQRRGDAAGDLADDVADRLGRGALFVNVNEIDKRGRNALGLAMNWGRSSSERGAE